MPQTDKPVLVRAIGRWGLAALMVNSIIGSGVFGLPSPVAKLVCGSGPFVVVIAGAAVGVIMACYAEVASHFSDAGGPYLYARVAFGRLAGIEVGWLFWLVRLAAPAANADLFATYLGEFWPHASAPMPRAVVITLLIGTLTFVNLRGVRTGVQISNILTIAKLVPLCTVAVVGVVHMAAQHKGLTIATSGTSTDAWLRALLLLVFAYGGFETALTPMGEAKDPRRDVAFALFAALITCTLIYAAVQWAVSGTLVGPAHSERPVADVARVLLGRGGATLVTVGALISMYGYLSANILAVPRMTFALAERGDFPKVFAAIGSQTLIPYFSVLVFSLLVWLLALFGSFSWNATLSAIARLFYYALGCAALPVLRRKQPGGALFRLPGGTFFAMFGILICLVLITRVDRSGSLVLLATVSVAFLNWVVARRRGPIAAEQAR